MNLWIIKHRKWALSVALLLSVCALLFGCDAAGSPIDTTTPPAQTTGPLQPDTV